MFYKTLLGLSLVIVVGCSEEGFNQTQFDKLQNELVDKELALVSAQSDSARESAQKLLLLCRTEIKKSQATFFILKTSNLSSNTSFFRQKEIITELQTLIADEADATLKANAFRDLNEAISRMNGVEVSFDEVVVGARGKSHWVYLKRGGNAYASLLNPNNHRIDLDKTEGLLDGEIPTGLLKLSRGSTSDLVYFESDQASSEIFHLDESEGNVSKKLICFDGI